MVLPAYFCLIFLETVHLTPVLLIKAELLTQFPVINAEKYLYL